MTLPLSPQRRVLPRAVRTRLPVDRLGTPRCPRYVAQVTGTRPGDRREFRGRSGACEPARAASAARAATPERGSTAPLRSIRLRPQIRRDYPLNLSILLSGGKETNQDSLSSGERRGKSPAPNPRPTGGRGKCGVRKTACPVSIGGLSPSDRGSARGRCEAGNGPRRAGVRSSRSRVVWECSPKRVVNSI